MAMKYSSPCALLSTANSNTRAMFSCESWAVILGFVDEHAQKVLVGGQVVEDLLDGHQVRAPLVVEGLGAEDLGHASERDAVEELIAP